MFPFSRLTWASRQVRLNALSDINYRHLPDQKRNARSGLLPKSHVRVPTGSRRYNRRPLAYTPGADDDGDRRNGHVEMVKSSITSDRPSNIMMANTQRTCRRWQSARSVKLVWHLRAGRASAPAQQSRFPFVSQADLAGSPARRRSATVGPPSG